MSYFKSTGGYHWRYEGLDTADRYLRCQIDVMARHGITPIIGTNFPLEYNGIKAMELPLFATHSSFCNKLPALSYMIKQLGINDDICYQDVDLWTLIPHQYPSQKDMAFCLHSLPPRTKLQLGCQYWGKGSYDILHDLADTMIRRKVKKEESFFNGFFKQKKCTDRIEILNYKYNFFRQSEMEKKWPLTQLPIINIHCKPEYDSVWFRFMGKNKMGAKVIPDWLVHLFYKHGLRK